MVEGARRTFASYKTQVLHSLGNPDESELDITPGDLVNDALEHIAAMHPWQWLSTGETVLSVTADQDYVELPADFGQLIAIDYANSWALGMIPVTWDMLLHLRNNHFTITNLGYYYTINLGNVELGDEDAGLTLPTLNLWPTPSSSETDVISLVYRRFLRRLVDDDDRPQWPSYMDRALSLLARSMAATDYDDDPESAYTAEFRNLIDDLKSRDGLARGSLGMMQGALTDRLYPSVDTRYTNQQIPPL